MEKGKEGARPVNVLSIQVVRVNEGKGKQFFFICLPPETGDNLLKEVERRLRTSLRKTAQKGGSLCICAQEGKSPTVLACPDFCPTLREKCVRALQGIPKKLRGGKRLSVELRFATPTEAEQLLSTVSI